MDNVRQRTLADRVPRSARRRIELAGGGLALAWALYATAGMMGGAAKTDAREAELRALRTQVATMRADVGALTAAVKTTADRIEHRHVQLAALMDGGPADVQLAALEPAPAVADPATARVLAPLVALEAKQLAFVGQATAAAEARHRGALATIRALGLEPGRFTRATAMGGPLEEAAPSQTPAQGVQDLYQAWNRLAQLGQAAAAIPARKPVEHYQFTSGFGVRYDPFTGASAMHAGVDMAGAHGEAIVSAAEGVVTKAGWMGGYGNMIEIDHGLGLSTRYGHLSRVQVKVGDRVVIGDQIGKMGSTGRSTGTHLHFEVRVDGRAVDPVPYLRAGPRIAQIQTAAAPDPTGRLSGLGGPVVRSSPAR